MSARLTGTASNSPVSYMVIGEPMASIKFTRSRAGLGVP